VAESRRMAASGQMRAAGGELQANQVGQAAERQKRIAAALRQALDVLALRRSPGQPAAGQGGLTAQQLAGLEDALKRFRREEQKFLEETRRIDRARQVEGR